MATYTIQSQTNNLELKIFLYLKCWLSYLSYKFSIYFKTFGEDDI